MSSHVLLAACGHAQLAFEENNQGKFTAALIKLLKSRDPSSMTYEWCMQHFPKLETESAQDPVCEGKNTHRIFFDSKLPGANPSFILVKSNDKGTFLQAGTAQGITPQSKFKVYADHVLSDSDNSLGTFEVDTIEAFRSSLKSVDPPAPTLPSLTYGRQVSYGKEQVLRLKITEEFLNAAKPEEKWPSLLEGNQDTLPVVLVETNEEADLIMSYEDGETTFTTTNPVAVRHKIHRLPAKGVAPEFDQVRLILAAVGRWNWHVNRGPGYKPFDKSVKMELLQLKDTGLVQGEGAPIFEPTSQNLIQRGVADIVVGNPRAEGEKYNGPVYGLKVHNTSTRDLYAHLFRYSIRDQSISAKYVTVLPASTDSMDPTLPRGIPLTLGYGSSGESPLVFELKDKDMDATFWRLFVTTKPTSFTSLEQHSPFGHTRQDLTEKEVQDLLKTQDLWDVFTMLLVERRTRAPGSEPDIPPAISSMGPIPEPAIATDSMDLKGRKFVWKGPWFDTEPLTEQMLSLKLRMRLRTKAYLEKGVESQAGDGWFEIGIVDPEDPERLKQSSEGKELSYVSHHTLNEQSTWADGPVFEPEHDIWKDLKPDDSLRVIMKVKGEKWIHNADMGGLYFWV